MSATHDTVVKREMAKYDSEWLVFSEVSYGGYRFDILAFNPKTKALEIIEVDIANKTDPEKVKYAETLGKVKVFRSNGDKIIPKEFQILLKAVSNVNRITIMEYLFNQGRQRYTDLMVKTKSLPTKDAGRFAYHLNYLTRTKLVNTDENGYYVITPKGAKIISFCENLDK